MGLRGPTSKAPTSKGRGWEGKGRCQKIIYAPGRQKPLRHHC